jgi:hypothetical protein
MVVAMASASVYYYKKTPLVWCAMMVSTSNHHLSLELGIDRASLFGGRREASD